MFEIVSILLIALMLIIAIWSIRPRALYFKAHHFFFLIGFGYYMILYPLFYIFGFTKDSHSEELVLHGLIVSFIGLISYLLGRWLFGQILSSYIIDRGVFDHGAITKVGNNGAVIIRNRYFFILILLPSLVLIESGYISKSLIFLIAVSLIILMRRNNKGKRILIFATIVISIFFVKSTTSRSDIVGVLICSFVIIQYLGTKGFFKNLVSLLSLSLTILGGVLWITITRSFDISQSKMVSLNRMYDHHGGITGMLLTLADFGVGHDNYLYIIDNIKEIGYLWGISFIRIFFAIIPREIWLEKPFDAQIIIVNQDIATNTYTRGSAQGMTFIGELYWNMGVIAVIIGMMLFGVLLSLFEKKLLSKKPEWVMFSLVMVPYAFLLWRGGFNTSGISMVLSAACLISIYKITVFLHLFFRKSCTKNF